MYVYSNFFHCIGTLLRRVLHQLRIAEPKVGFGFGFAAETSLTRKTATLHVDPKLNPLN